MGSVESFIDSDEVCELLGITHNNLYQIIYRKQLKFAEKKGKRKFFDKKDVVELKAKRTK